MNILILIIDPQAGTKRDLMATSGEYLRIWEVGEQSKQVKCISRLFNVRDYHVSDSLFQNKHSEYCAPLTSFDWNQ